MFDVVIIGSGFGGAVAAARAGLFAQGSGRRVLVLDKGIDPTGRFDPLSDGPPLNEQGNRFQHSLAPDYLTELGELFTDPRGAYRSGVPSMNVVTGKGLGGGSLLYDGVSLRAPSLVFDQVRRGRRLWPAAFSRAALQPWYRVVEQQLRVHKLEWTDANVPHWQLATKRDFVFAEGCRRIGATAAPLKLATFQDANEGWWNQGQRFSGRQDLTKNYLSTAHAAGVELRTGHDVDTIAPTNDGYVVKGVDTRGGKKVEFEIECRVLIVAAGAIASSALLLRSRDHFVGERTLDRGDEDNGRAVLGQHLSSNGDYGVTGRVGADFERAVESFKGKPMSSFCPSFWPEHQFILIPFHAAPLYPALEQITTMNPPEHPNALGRGSTKVAERGDGKRARNWGADFKRQLTEFGTRSLTMGCLALDACEGEILADADRVRVQWRETSERTEERWSAAVDAMRRIYEALGGELFCDNYRKDGTVNTSHPLGGCRMADEATEGVVDPFGEAFGNRNLFVMDGAIIPSALGVNPSLTIAAVAEHLMDRLIRGDGTEALADRLA